MAPASALDGKSRWFGLSGATARQHIDHSQSDTEIWLVDNIGDNKFALACEDGTLYTIDGRDGQFKARGYGDAILRMVKYPGLPVVLIALETGAVFRVDTETHQATAVSLHGEPLVAAAAGLCGEEPVVYACTPQRIHAVTARGWVLLQRPLLYHCPSAVSVVGSDVEVLFEQEGAVEVFDCHTLSHLGVQKRRGLPILHVCDGAVLFQGKLSLGVRPRQDSSLVYYLPGHPDVDDGKLFNSGRTAVVYRDNVVTIYDVPTESVLREIKVADAINDLAFSNDLLFVAHRSGFTSFKLK
jgi:hypothetical protein